jgi:hypothetical protein
MLRNLKSLSFGTSHAGFHAYWLSLEKCSPVRQPGIPPIETTLGDEA